MRLWGRYLNFGTEAERIRDLYKRAASERVERTYSPPVRTVSRLSLDQNKQIATLFRAGMCATEIARETDINVCAVHHRLNRVGVQRRTGGLPLSQILEAKRLYESGESLRQIGFKMGFHDKTVKKALVDAGVGVQDRRRKH